MSNPNGLAILSLLMLQSLFAQTAHPGAAKQTFPSTPVGGASAPVTLSFTFDTPGTLFPTPYALLTKGALNLDFQAAATQPANACLGGHLYSAGSTCAVSLIFTPTKPSYRLGAAQLVGLAGTPIATFNLVGTGVGPQIAFQSNSAPTTLLTCCGVISGAAVDGSGDLFVPDGILKEFVATNGKVSPTSPVIQVGSGLDAVESVALDGSGNVFVVDASDNTVKEILAVDGKVSSSSTVVTVASGFTYLTGVAVDAGGNVFVTDFSNNAVNEIVAVNGTVSSSSTVVTVGSGFEFPSSVAVDGSGNVFVTDQGHNAVKEIVAVDGSVSSSSTVVTVGSGFSSPSGVAVDGSENVFVADRGNDVVKEIVAVNGEISATSTVITLAGGFTFVIGVAVGSSSGNVFATGAAVQELDRSDPPTFNFIYPSNIAAQSVAIENIGNAPLVETALTVSANFTQVPGSGTPHDCSASTTLAAGASCNLSIEPEVGPPLTGSVTLTNNNLNITGSKQTILLREPPTLASYTGLDTTTQGTWTGNYGADGQIIANDAAFTAPPSYATVTFTGDNAYTWDASTNDLRALQSIVDDPFRRIASTFYASTSYTINVDLRDGNTHRVALYLLDWDSTSRTETISILNAANNAVLDTRTFSSFHNGQYAIWNIQGNVIIKVTRTGGSNAVVSGLFFDPALSAATYTGLDTTTQGTWTGKYGAEGNMIAKETAATPAYADVTFTGDTAYTWASSSTDARALQTSSGATTRIASTYYSPTSFDINVNLTDGITHRISLYLLDWDTTARTENIEILNAQTNAVLDTESFSNFHNGDYAAWYITGDVIIKVTRTGGGNAVVSGIFFD